MPTYTPEPLPITIQEPELGEYLWREFLRISNALERATALGLEVISIEPERSTEGDIVYADGTLWNPGDGEGVYVYKNGAWVIFATGTGSGYQPLDQELTAIAGLVSAADRLPYFTGSGTAALATFTSFGRSLVDDANAGAALTTLGVSAYVQTLLDDANAAAARATLELATTDTATFDKLRLNSITDITLVSTGHAFQIGPDSGVNLTIDTNEIQARNNGIANGLNINNEGGNTHFGGGIEFGNVVAGSVTDLSNHIALYSTTFGFCVTGSTLNYNVPAGSTHRVRVNGAEIMQVNLNGIILGTDMELAFTGTGAAETRSNLGLGTLATMDLTDLYYTGSNANNLSYPVTSYVWMRMSAGTVARNASSAVYLFSGDSNRFINDSGASGGTLTGTWRGRGIENVNNYGLMQRTA